MGLIDVISKYAEGSIRGLATNLFEGYIERGISANAALQELKDMGLGYRRTDFLSDFREATGAFASATRIRSTGLDNVPSEGILEAKYYGVPDKYSLLIKYDRIDNISGEESTGYIYYHRNTLTTRAQMQDDAEAYLTEQSSKYPWEISNVNIAAGYINPLWK